MARASVPDEGRAARRLDITIAQNVLARKLGSDEMRKCGTSYKDRIRRRAFRK